MIVMKFRNRNQKWSEKDVYILTRLMKERVATPTIAAVLGRTEASLRHAVKNTLYQQLLHHMPSDIMTYYQMEDNELYQDVVNPVYYQEITSQNSTETVGDTCDDADTQDEVEHTPQHFSTCEYILTSITTVLVAGGIAVYFKLVADHWDTLMK